MTVGELCQILDSRLSEIAFAHVAKSLGHPAGKFHLGAAWTKLATKITSSHASSQIYPQKPTYPTKMADNKATKADTVSFTPNETQFLLSALKHVEGPIKVLEPTLLHTTHALT